MTDVGASFPALLLRNAERFADRPAQRHKRYGIWGSWTWAEMAEEIEALALGLRELGFQSGDRIAIIGRNRPQLYWAIAAAQSLGGIAVPAYHDSAADEIAYILGHAEVSFAAVEDQEQVDKLDSLGAQLPNIRHVLVDEPRGLDDYRRDNLHDVTAVQARGRAAIAQQPALGSEWRAGISALGPEDLAAILYTSGTTGRPKGVMLTYRNLITAASNAIRFDRLDESDEVLAYLPMAWVGDHILSYAQAYCAGYCVCCPESPETVAQDRHEIAPTYFFAPPRVFEEMLTKLMIGIDDAGPVRRRMFHYFLEVARRSGPAIHAGAPVSWRDRVLYAAGNCLLYRPVKNRFGLSRLKVGYTAGEAIGPDMFGFYRSIGLNLKQLYGQTEASVYVTMHADRDVDSETVGIPAAEVELRVSDAGEVQFRSPGVFRGYYRDPDQTREAFTPDGWVRTGDAGFIDKRGHLRIIDRAKDVGRLIEGSLFAPKYVENKLKFFPEIKEVVAIGNGRDFCTAMINIDLVALANWAERKGISYGGYQELAARREVYEVVGGRVAEVNRTLAREPRTAPSQIKRYLILHKELDADDGELTRTQKLRRRVIAERYASLVDALYRGPGLYHVQTEIVFEDGRRGTLAGRVEVRDAEMFGSAGATATKALAA